MTEEEIRADERKRVATYLRVQAKYCRGADGFYKVWKAKAEALESEADNIERHRGPEPLQQEYRYYG